MSRDAIFWQNAKVFFCVCSKLLVKATNDGMRTRDLAEIVLEGHDLEMQPFNTGRNVKLLIF